MAEGVPATLSLRSRVVLAVAAVLCAGAAIVLWLALSYGRQAAREAYDRLLLGAASDIAESITVRDGVALVDLPISAFEMLALAPDDRVRYRVLGRGGETLTGDPMTPLPDTRDDPAFFDAAFGDEPARYVSVTRRFAERGFSGPIRVIVGQTTLARQTLARDIARRALAGLTLAGAAMAGFAWLAVSRAMRPLPRIGAALAAREPTDLTPVTEPAPREIAALLGSINAFMGRLAHQDSANRNLISDAAHQLRTPVAAIHAQTQLALRESDPEARTRNLARIASRSADLGRLLDQLLSRAMVIHRTDYAPRTTLDLRDVAVEVVEQSDDLLAGIGDAVELILPGSPVELRGDAMSLTEAGKNFVSNAVRHGRPPIRVGVTVGPEPSLWVEDSGPGPEVSVMASLGTRFSRLGGGGGGIGLAIAREVAEAHQGRLTADTRPEGFRIALVLRAVAAP